MNTTTFQSIMREVRSEKIKVPAALTKTPKVAKTVSPRPLSPRASWIAATADWKTSAERLASYVPEIEGSGEGESRVVIMAGATRAEMGRVHDLTDGAVRITDVNSQVRQLALGHGEVIRWKGRDGKIRSTTNATTSAAVAACLARLKAAKHGSMEYRAAKGELRDLKAA